MPVILYKSLPFSKEDATQALESGVDGIVAPREHVARIERLACCMVVAAEDMPSLALCAKADEAGALARMKAGERIVLARGWEVIPVENLLAQSDAVAVEAGSLDEALLAAGILERGVQTLVLLPSALPQIREITAALKYSQARQELVPARITGIRHAGLGHRVCVDALSVFQRGQGLLTGNSSAFTFLVHAETERNEYVAARPFRINAGAVHAYVIMPNDRTRYLEELRAGDEALIVDAAGESRLAAIGRVKVEARPMLLIEAETPEQRGAIFLQNAETIRLVTPQGAPVSVVDLKQGDQVLCRIDGAGRHFGMRIKEDITEA
ncbi:MAG: 3-dehydroquinate synthase II family protein [Deltaproteobacteria bacterium]|jgi:3-dehydroquinate synthase II|nr:3-dehydroquinate synthase II family protein [Deltaproteobacteria bacterium]